MSTLEAELTLKNDVIRRSFIELEPKQLGVSEKSVGVLRMIQFNLLADGLSALRPDLGDFSRGDKSFLDWSVRKHALLQEVLQYEPDIISLQECDHFHDFFYPELFSQGYEGYFAAKPNSTCLEYSDLKDGCALFVKLSKLEVTSVEVVTYSLDRKEVEAIEGQGAALPPPPPVTEGADNNSIPQNQGFLLLSCKLLNSAIPVPILIATTHLKSTKSAVGESLRLLQIRQLLSRVEHGASAADCAVIIAGDFNATPRSTESFPYPCLVYEYVLSHPLGLRSLLTQDVVLEDGEEYWTTWKARWKHQGSSGERKEQIVKHCIDYLLYRPLSLQSSPGSIGVRAIRTLRPLTEEEAEPRLLPNERYPSDHLAIVADLEIVMTHPPSAEAKLPVS